MSYTQYCQYENCKNEATAMMPTGQYFCSIHSRIFQINEIRQICLRVNPRIDMRVLRAIKLSDILTIWRKLPSYTTLRQKKCACGSGKFILESLIAIDRMIFLWRIDYEDLENQSDECISFIHKLFVPPEYSKTLSSEV